MKTASIVASLSRKAGGLFESVRRLHQSLAELPEITVSVLGLRDEFTDEDLPQWKPLRVRAFPVHGPTQFGYAPQLKRALIEGDEQIIHNNGLWMYPSVAVSAWHRKTKGPYLISPHGMVDEWALKNSSWKKAVARIAYENGHLRNAACLRALCESEARSMRALGLRNPICIIANGIDLPESRMQTRCDGATARREAKSRNAPWAGQVESHRKILFYLGRLHPKKNLLNLLDAWAETQRNFKLAKDWALVVAGWDQGAHETELRQRIADCGIGASVLMCGALYSAAKASAYNNADAFILPSLSEGLPMVILEAWACGKPVLMTPECNLPEGFATESALGIGTSVESIAAGLDTLFAMSDSDRTGMGERGRQLVAEKFTWPRIAAEMKSVYDWLLGGGTAPNCVWDK
jgi:glycosyltransferase involved in cell wall biosynthesis